MADSRWGILMVLSLFEISMVMGLGLVPASITNPQYSASTDTQQTQYSTNSNPFTTQETTNNTVITQASGQRGFGINFITNVQKFPFLTLLLSFFLIISVVIIISFWIPLLNAS